MIFERSEFLKSIAGIIKEAKQNRAFLDFDGNKPKIKREKKLKYKDSIHLDQDFQKGDTKSILLNKIAKTLFELVNM